MSTEDVIKQSGPGIASVIIALLSGLAEIILVVTAGIMESVTGGMDEDAIGTVILGLLVIGGVMLAFVGLVLGIVGLFQSNRKKIFPVIGTIFNFMIIAGVIFLVVLGTIIG